MTTTALGRTALYRFFDAQGVLLYVGITVNPKQRWAHHATHKSWWPAVARRTTEWFETWRDALHAEQVAIVSEEPLHNKIHATPNMEAARAVALREQGIPEGANPLEASAFTYHLAKAERNMACAELEASAVEAMTRGVPMSVAVRITGWSREHLRSLGKKAREELERAHREAEVEALRRKVEELSTTSKPQAAVAAPRVQVSAVVLPESEPTEPDAEATTTEPLPEMLPREFRKVVARAMSRAKPDQRERLNLTAKTSEQLGRDKNDAVLKAAFEMGLLKHDEVYGERPASSEETTA